MFIGWSFNRKLQTAIGLLGLTSLITTGFLTYNLNHESVSSKSNLIEKAADGIADKLDRNLFERFGDVQAFALSEPARSGDPERINKFMNDMMAAYAPIYDVMMVLDKTGKVVALNKIDKKGKNLDITTLKNKNFSDKDWFKACINNQVPLGQAFYTDLYVESEFGKFAATDGKIMTFAAPIRDSETGEILGVWSNQMSWRDVVVELVQSESKKLVDDRITLVIPHLLDAKGVYLHHPEESKILNGRDEKSSDFLSSTSNGRSEILDNSESIDGSTIKAYSRELGFSSYPGKAWTITLEVPKTDKYIQQGFILSIIGFTFLVFISTLAIALANSTSRKLKEIIFLLETESQKVHSNANEVNSTAQILSDSSSHQAATLQQTAASMDEINAMIKKSSDNSSRSQTVATNSSVIAKKGQASVEKMSIAINEINVSNEAILNQINKSNNQISDIARVITEIGNKTKVINDIVFQTKLLSFNASVEAARAGENGKGFAVVAEEVGNLAQMSGNAAKEISDMLTESIKNVEQTISESKRSVGFLIAEGQEKIKSGISLTEQCGTILKEVVENVDDVAEMVSEISSAGREQTLGVSEISKAISDLDSSTSANTDSAQKVFGNANSLAEQSENLNTIVFNLSALVTGKNATNTGNNSVLKSTSIKARSDNRSKNRKIAS